jgi:hypothetical protein
MLTEQTNDVQSKVFEHVDLTLQDQYYVIQAERSESTTRHCTDTIKHYSNAIPPGSGTIRAQWRIVKLCRTIANLYKSIDDQSSTFETGCIHTSSS